MNKSQTTQAAQDHRRNVELAVAPWLAQAIGNNGPDTGPKFGAELRKAIDALLGVSEPGQASSDMRDVAEALIKQLPADHDGRNSWLMNYGAKE